MSASAAPASSADPASEADPGSSSSRSVRDREQSLRQLALLRQQKTHLDRQLRDSADRNEKLAAALQRAKEDILRLRQALSQEIEAPMNTGRVLRVNPPRLSAAHLTQQTPPAALTQASLDVIMSGREVRVAVNPLLDLDQVAVGTTVLLNETMGACAVLGYRATGEIATVRELLGTDRVVLGTGNNTQVVALRSGALREEELKIGDAVSYDPASGIALGTVPKADAEELVLGEVPETTFEDIGGLESQIEQIRDAVELPFLHPELFREHDLKPPQGILLYGPPGNGKTLIAKAVAKSLAQRMAQLTGREDVSGFFFNVKGPELLDKFVGETERQIRSIFTSARERASAGHPVVIFFDEMESLFRTRGSGKSSDVETTIVPQLLAEIDGVETLDNVIVIGATNREDMIDPAVMRPGRLDVKVRIERPDRSGAAQIFGLYIRPELPLRTDELAEYDGDRQRTVAELIEAVTEEVFGRTPQHRCLEAVLADGRVVLGYWSDFLSGALIRNIVDRAKKLAIKDFLRTGTKGLGREHLLCSARDEFEQQRDALSRSDVEDWLQSRGHSAGLQSIERPRHDSTAEAEG